MKRFALVAGVLVRPGLVGSPADAADPSRSVVKLYVTTVVRDVAAPWRPGWSFAATRGAAEEGGGGRRTNARRGGGYRGRELR